MKSNFESIILNGNLKKFNELLMRNLTQVKPQEVIDIVILGVHAKNKIYVLSRYQKSLSIVLSNSLLYSEVNQNLFIEGLVVVSII